MRVTAAFIVLSALALPAPSPAAEVKWDAQFWNPAAEEDDLVLPLPCGGGVAFRRVDTPVSADEPLADRKIRLGRADESTGFLDYFRADYLRGGFTEGDTPHYWIMKYELTQDQHRALLGDCGEPSLAGARPAGGLSWFDAVALSRRATEWLLAEAPDTLPAEEEVSGFVRLPTEVEWEFAARGGVAVDPTDFRAALFPMEGPLRDYAWHAARDSANGNLRPIGRIEPNPLGLFGMLGGVEEIVLDPFRLNALGRPHGQAGGFVTRGGSIETEARELGTALRQENPFFAPSSGAANAYDTFGARFVLAVHVNVSLGRTNAIRERWLEQAEADPELEEDPLALLERMRDTETEKEHRAELDLLHSTMVADRRARTEAADRALRLSLLNGAAMMQLLRSERQSVKELELARGVMERAIERAEASDDAAQQRLLQKRRGLVEQKDLQIERAGELLETIGNGYANTLTEVVFEHSEDEVRAQADTLKIELGARGQAGMILLVEEFVQAASAYRDQPDVPRAVLLEAAWQ